MSLSSHDTIFHFLGIFLLFSCAFFSHCLHLNIFSSRATSWSSENFSLLVLDHDKIHESTIIERYSFSLRWSKHPWVTRYRNRSSSERQRHLLSDQRSSNATEITQSGSISVRKGWSVHKSPSWSTQVRDTLRLQTAVGTFSNLGWDLRAVSRWQMPSNNRNPVRNCMSAVILLVVRDRDASFLTICHTTTIKTSFEERILRASMRNYWSNFSDWSNLLLFPHQQTRRNYSRTQPPTNGNQPQPARAQPLTANTICLSLFLCSTKRRHQPTNRRDLSNINGRWSDRFRTDRFIVISQGNPVPVEKKGIPE